MNPYWSWLLTGVGVTGLFIAGRKNWAGWAIGLGAQVLWVVYAIATRQWGFLASAGLYGAVYFRNIMRWRKEDPQPKPCRTVPCPPFEDYGVIIYPDDITEEQLNKLKEDFRVATSSGIPTRILRDGDGTLPTSREDH